METHHRIAVLCALPLEAEPVVDALQGAERSRRYGTDLVTGQLGDVPVVVCVGGMGKVAAGAAAQMLICEYHPETLIFSGIAGSLNPLLEIGDIVIGRSLVYLETNNDIIAECDPFLHTYASDDHLSALVCRVLDEQGYRRVPSLAEMGAADDDAAAADAAATVTDGGSRYVLGTIATSDQFNTDPDVLDHTRRVWHGDCEEMEGAAVAHVCAKNHVPFLAVRAMSNRCGEAYEDLNRHQSDMALAAQHAGAAVRAVLSALHVAQIHHA
ncbi:5'-methylthioadenosine/S-adenosylhomocysteine nucleosidase [Bifidobacterium thermophilum]|uniref:5'-methylthioadenosine/S-adenosylhomocysteine nucleosidase n=1 Tax=Bifidobacterium thermophilum TaxID=33905 RepID=UPI0039916577